ncbi:MAG: tRNA pseudouridine(38-40) synthase TruA [Acidimicrobiia bacterium]
MAVYKLTLAYDGSGFHGMAEQPDVRTVGGELRGVLNRILRHDVELSIAGRTDRGVHANGQVVSFVSDVGMEADKLRRAVNSTFAGEFVVVDAVVVEDSFDARRSAISRRYRYSIWNHPSPTPLLRERVWWVSEPLDRSVLRLAADVFVGLHDFATLCRPPGNGHMVRRVFTSRWLDLDDGRLVYEVSASAFCQQMVRAMVGLQVDVGRGKLTPGELLGILRARNRSAVKDVAPARGLVLEEVGYPSQPPLARS